MFLRISDFVEQWGQERDMALMIFRASSSVYVPHQPVVSVQVPRPSSES